LLSGLGVNYHVYADDTQLYIPIDPKYPTHNLKILENAINTNQLWMNTSFLKLNEDKTEILFINPRNTALSPTLAIGDLVISPNLSAKSLGVIFDFKPNFEKQISSITKSCTYSLRSIARIRRMLPYSVAEVLIHALISSRLDYCNSLLFGLPEYLLRKLQLLQNSSARLLSRQRKHERIEPTLKALHWLPIKLRISYKILLQTYKCLNSLAPDYLCDLISISQPVRSNQLDPAQL
jgi:hypothetical protein